MLVLYIIVLCCKYPGIESSDDCKWPLTCLKHNVKDKLMHFASDTIKERGITLNKPHWILQAIYNIGMFLWFNYRMTQMASSPEWDLAWTLES